MPQSGTQAKAMGLHVLLAFKCRVEHLAANMCVCEKQQAEQGKINQTLRQPCDSCGGAPTQWNITSAMHHKGTHHGVSAVDHLELVVIDETVVVPVELFQSIFEIVREHWAGIVDLQR